MIFPSRAQSEKVEPLTCAARCAHPGVLHPAMPLPSPLGPSLPAGLEAQHRQHPSWHAVVRTELVVNTLDVKDTQGIRWSCLLREQVPGRCE